MTHEKHKSHDHMRAMNHLTNRNHDYVNYKKRHENINVKQVTWSFRTLELLLSIL